MEEFENNLISKSHIIRILYESKMRKIGGSVAAARKTDLDWITKTIDVIVCFVLCLVFIVFGEGYQTNWSKSYESCYMTQNR